MGNNPGFLLGGASCSAALTAETVTLSGNYYRYDIHKRRKVSGTVTVDLLNVLRVGLTKTYSRLMLAIPMCFGFAALGIKAIPSVEVRKTLLEIPDVWSFSPGVTFWSLPHQDFLWKLCAVLCLLTIPLYWLSYRNDLEVNTTQGRYLLPRKGMDAAQIASFQREFTQAKMARQKQSKRI